MTLFHSPSVQSPAAYSNQNLAGSQLAARMAGTASAAQRGNLRTAIQDSGYRYKIHALETAAGLVDANLTFGFDLYDLRRYNGGIDDASAFSDTGMTNVLAVIAAKGGVVWMPAGTYKFANPISLNLKNGVILQGDGAPTSGASPGTLVQYTGTGAANFITMTGAQGCQVNRMKITHTVGTFVGALIAGGHTSGADCTLCSIADLMLDCGLNSAYQLDLDKTIDFVAQRCNFSGGTVQIKGQASAGGSYSNVVSILHCRFGSAVAAPINYGGESWLIQGCVFEPLSNGTAGAFQTLSTAQNVSCSIVECWMGDATVAGGTWITQWGPSLVVQGNLIAGDVSNGTFGVTLNGVAGAQISGNDFVSLSVALNLANSQSKGVVFQGNNLNSVTTAISGGVSFGDGASFVIGPNNPMIGAAGAGLSPFFNPARAHGWRFDPNSGMYEEWGEVAITPGTGAAVVYNRAFGAIPHLTVSTSSPSVVGDFVYSGAETVNGFNINANGATGTVTARWRALGY